jgi:hypothetical protein
MGNLMDTTMFFVLCVILALGMIYPNEGSSL